MEIDTMTPEEEQRMKDLGRYDLIKKGVCGKATSRIDIIGQNGNDGLHYEERASDKQVGGDHYKKHLIQPWDIIDAYHLDFYEGNALKYLLRTKGSREEDIKKAIHYLEKILENRSR
jgi:hypothetical protein